MKLASDIQNLYAMMGEKAVSYQEIVRDEKTLKCRTRWPLLAEILTEDISTPASNSPTVQAQDKPAVKPEATLPPARPQTDTTQSYLRMLPSPASKPHVAPAVTAKSKPVSVKLAAVAPRSDLMKIFKRIEATAPTKVDKPVLANPFFLPRRSLP